MIILNSAQEIIEYIKNAKKKTPVKVYLKGKNLPDSDEFLVFGVETSRVLIGDYEHILKYMEENKNRISDSYLEIDRKNSAIPMLDISSINARIEPGSLIRENVIIGDHAVIMMGAIINIGASIGERTMIDMGAIVGGRAIIGKRCHIGAGAVIAGVIEPPSATPVIVEDDVMIGANAVIIEGVHVGKGAVIGAGSIVTRDVEANSVVAGNPAKVIKQIKDDATINKTQLLDDLRKL